MEKIRTKAVTQGMSPVWLLKHSLDLSERAVNPALEQLVRLLAAIQLTVQSPVSSIHFPLQKLKMQHELRLLVLGAAPTTNLSCFFRIVSHDKAQALLRQERQDTPSISSYLYQHMVSKQEARRNRDLRYLSPEGWFIHQQSAFSRLLCSWLCQPLPSKMTQQDCSCPTSAQVIGALPPVTQVRTVFSLQLQHLLPSTRCRLISVGVSGSCPDGIRLQKIPRVVLPRGLLMLSE